MRHTIEHYEDGLSLITIEGDMLGLHQFQPLLDEVDHLILEDHNLFVIDLQNTRFLNSSGLSVLTMILAKARKAGGEVVLSEIPDTINKLLVITKLNSIFTIMANREEAIVELRSLLILE